MATRRPAFLGDRLIRYGDSARAARRRTPAARQPGPLVAVRLHVLTRKTLGGLETDLRRPRAAPGRRGAARRVRGRRGGRLRRRRDARLPRPRGYVPRRLPVQRPDGGPVPRGGSGLVGVCAAASVRARPDRGVVGNKVRLGENSDRSVDGPGGSPSLRGRMVATSAAPQGPSDPQALEGL